MPFSAFLISPSAAMINRVMIDSTSSPTYPDSVNEVASAIVNGTSRIFASVSAISVFPHPVGPANRMLFLRIRSLLSLSKRL